MPDTAKPALAEGSAPRDPRAPRDAGLLRFRRVMGTIGATLGLTVVFATSLVGSVLVHLNAAPTRATARVIANDIFVGLFKGKLIVGEIDRLSLAGVTVRSAEAFDTNGERVVHADLIRADADVLGIVRSALIGPGDMRIYLPLIQLGNADVALLKNADGVPSIAEVFLPKTPSPPPPPSAPPSRNVRVLLERIQIDHGWAHGDLAAPGLDAEVASTLARVEVGPEGVTVDVDPAGVGLRAPLPRDLGGNATFHLKVVPEVGVSMNAGFDGKLGDLDVHTTAQLAGTRLAARVEVAHATAAAIAALIPGAVPPTIPLRVPVSALVEVEGNIPELNFRTKLTLDDDRGWISADGTLALKSPVTVDVNVGVHEVDPLAILDLASAARLSADAHVWIEAGAQPKIDATVVTKPFAILGNVIPAVDLKATLVNGKLQGAAVVSEIGAPVHGTFSMDLATEDIGFDVDAKVASIRGIHRVVIPVDGGATVNVKGSLSLKTSTLDARVHANVGSIRAPGEVALESGTVDGRLSGPLKALQVDATVSGRGLQAGYYAWQTVLVHARGPLLAPRVDAKLDTGSGETIEVSGSLDGATKSVRDVDMRVKRNGGEVVGKIARVAATAGGVTIDGLSVEGTGIGGLKGGVVIWNKEIIGKLRGENVDLAKLAELASYPGHLAGVANLDVELSSSRAGDRKGRIAVEFVNLEASIVHGVSGSVTATFDGDHVRTDALVQVVAHAQPEQKPEDRCDGGIAQLRVTGGDGVLPGALLDPHSWAKATGHIEVAADDWNLRCVQKLIPPLVPMPDVRGKLTTRITLDREKNARFPVLKSFFARTLGLQVRDKTWQSMHTDVEVDASLDEKGAVEAKVVVFDGTPLATLAAKTVLDVPLLLEKADEGVAKLMKTPVHATLDVPRHAVTAFAGLPTFITDAAPLLTGKGGETLGGEIELHVDADGTIDAPTVKVALKSHQLAQVTLADLPATKPNKSDTKTGEAYQDKRLAVLGAWGLPIDLDATASYDGAHAALDATVTHGGKVVSRADVKLGLPLADLIAGQLKPTGRVQVDFDAFPFGEVPFFADRDIAGSLSGQIKMEDIGTKPSLGVHLHMDKFAVGRELTYDKATIDLDVAAPAGDGHSATKLDVAFTGPKAGKFTAVVASEIKWSNGIVPAIDPDRPASLEVHADAFNVAVAQPFIASAVSRMDGRLDGVAKVQWASHQPKIDTVDFKFTRGLFNLPALGQELQNVSLALSADAQGVLRVKDLTASGAKGRMTGGGYAQFDGLVFKKAELAFNIKKEEALPVTIQGVPLGDVTGSVQLSAETLKGGDLQLKIGFPGLHVDLAAALGRSVQSSDDNVDITVLQEARALEDAKPLGPPGSPVGVAPVSPGTPVPAGSPPPVAQAGTPAVAGKPAGKPAPLPPPPLGPKIVIVVDPLNVSLKGKLLGKVPIDGSVAGSKTDPVRLELGGKHPRLSGLLAIPRFSVEVFHGKQFVIEGGSVKLNPDDAARSFVNATARWDSPDGTSFNVDFIGEATPLSADKLKDKLKCRASNLSQEKCFSALLFGPDQASSAGSGPQGQTLAAQLIASEFSADIGGGISVNLGTTDDGSFKPGVQYNVGKAVLEASTYGVSGSSTTTTSASGGNTSQGQHYLVTLDWRFWRNWSVRGKVDLSADTQAYGADLLWQYRY